MSLPKIIPYSLIICLSLIGLLNVNAEPITAEWLDVQQALLDKAVAALPADEKALGDKIVALKSVTDKMLQSAAEQRQAANQKVAKLRLELTKAKAQLKKQKEAISTLTAKLEELSQYPRAELTVAQNQSIDDTQKQLAEPQQAIVLEKRHIEILKQQIDLAAKKTALALKWHLKLQNASFEPLIKKREEMIAVAKTSVESQKDALEMAETEQPNKIAQLKSVQVTVDELSKQFDKAGLDKDAAEVDLSNLTLERQNAIASLDKKRLTLKEQQDKLENLRKATGEKAVVQEQKIFELENKVKQQEKLLALDEQELDILNQRVELAKKQVALAIRWYEELQPVLAERKKLDSQAYMQKKQQEHLVHAANLRSKLNQLPFSDESAAERELLKVQIQEANEQSQQVERQLKTLSIEEQLTDWQTQTDKPTDEAKAFSKKKLETLQGAMDSVGGLLDELHTMQTLLQGKLAILDKQQNVLTKRGDSLSGKALASNKKAQKIIKGFKASLQKELDKIPDLQAKGQETLLNLETAYKEYSSLALWRMRELPTNQAEWQGLVKAISQVPVFLTQGFELTLNGVKQAFQQTPLQHWYKIAVILLIWIAFIFALIMWLKRRINASADKRLLGSRLLKMNVFSIAVIGMVSLLLWQIQPNMLTITVAFIFLFTWLAGKMLINLLRLSLEKVDFKLYKKLRWRIVFLAIVSIFVSLVHIEPEGDMLALSVPALDMIDTVFMLLLSLLVLPLFRLRKVMLSNLFKEMTGYWHLVISLIGLLLPLAILAVSALALLGYVTMAWMLVKQLSVFLLVMTAWLIAQGILAVLVELWKDSKDKESRFYDMWTTDLIPLYSKFIGFILFVLAVIAVASLNGWYSDLAINGYLQQTLTIGNLLVGLVLLWIVFWLGNWFRILTYRWIYLNITDNGLQIDRLRSNLTIGISHRDELHVAEKLIMDVLEEIPETLPQYDVWLSEITNSQVNLTVRYFVDYKKVHPLKVQSKVLFMIWDRFKEEGITIPFPQQDVHVKSMTADDNFKVQQVV